MDNLLPHSSKLHMSMMRYFSLPPSVSDSSLITESSLLLIPNHILPGVIRAGFKIHDDIYKRIEVPQRVKEFVRNPLVKKVSIGGAIGGLTVVGAHAAAGSPYVIGTLMSKFGIVVSGYGTYHGAFVAGVQSFGATTLGLPTIFLGAGIGVLAYGGYHVYVQYYSNPSTNVLDENVLHPTSQKDDFTIFLHEELNKTIQKFSNQPTIYDRGIFFATSGLLSGITSVMWKGFKRDTNKA